MDEVKNATKRELARVRATAMEGSFGTQKEHYGLRKIAKQKKFSQAYSLSNIWYAYVKPTNLRIEVRGLAKPPYDGESMNPSRMRFHACGYFQ